MEERHEQAAPRRRQADNRANAKREQAAQQRAQATRLVEAAAGAKARREDA